MRRLVLAAALAFFAFAGSAGAATYYVSASGNDANGGGSPSSAWKTVGRVNNATLAPGDTVLFEGGQTFADDTLMPSGSGAAGAPVTFSSYGATRATISNANGAVWFSGKSFLTFSNLVLTTAGGANAVFAGSGSRASTDIVLRDSVVRDTAAIGVNSPNSGDTRWTISGNTITNTGDS